MTTTPRVFVSRPARLSAAQQTLDREWARTVATLGFVRVDIDRDEYEAPPWDQLRGTVEAVDGAIVLGFRQLVVDTGLERPATPEEHAVHRSHPSAWNHLEAGLAIMAGVPVLVAAERGIADGVFASDVWGGLVHGVALDSWTAGSPEREPAVEAWAEAVRERASLRR